MMDYRRGNPGGGKENNRMYFLSFISIIIGFVALIVTITPDLVKYAQIHHDEDHNQVLFNYLKKVWNECHFKNTQSVYYAYIGQDENGKINADIVTNIFARYHELFNTFYFYGSQDCGNRVLYLFKCQDLNKPLEEYDLWKCCCGLCNEILNNYWHKYNPYTALPQDYHALTFYNGDIVLALAKNDDGARENSKIMAQTRLIYEGLNHNGNNNVNIYEDWKENPQKM